MENRHTIKIKNNATDEAIDTVADSDLNSVEIIIDSQSKGGIGIDIRVIYNLETKELRVVTDDHFNVWKKKFETFGYPED